MGNSCGWVSKRIDKLPIKLRATHRQEANFQLASMTYTNHDQREVTQRHRLGSCFTGSCFLHRSIQVRQGPQRLLEVNLWRLTKQDFLQAKMSSTSLHCALSLAAQCTVIGPVCMCAFVCVFVCGSVTTITRNCVHRSSPNWVCR